MRKGLFLILMCSFFISCSDEDPIWKLTGIELKNINNAGEFPLASNDSIPKEGYALDILYLGKTIDDNMEYSRIDFKNNKDTLVSQKIYCIYDLDDNYPAGSEVTKLFKPIHGNTPDVSNLYTKFHGGIFVLKYIPHSGLHSFRVEVMLGNGRVIEKSTLPVKLY